VKELWPLLNRHIFVRLQAICKAIKDEWLVLLRHYRVRGKYDAEWVQG